MNLRNILGAVAIAAASLLSAPADAQVNIKVNTRSHRVHHRRPVVVRHRTVVRHRRPVVVRERTVIRHRRPMAHHRRPVVRRTTTVIHR